METSPPKGEAVPLPLLVMIPRLALAGVVWFGAALIWCDALAPGSPILRPIAQAAAGVVRR